MPATTPQPEPVDPGLARRIPIIEYHDAEYKGGSTVRMTTAWFQEQLKWLYDNGFTTLSGDELLQFVLGNARPVKKSCVLRFDMGMPVFKNFQEVILPALEKYSFHALFFALTSSIKDTNKNNYVSWNDLIAWEQTGLVEVHSHGVYHPDYRAAATAARLWDARESKKILEGKLGHPVPFFTFPFDSVPSRPDLLLKLCGYQLGFAGSRTERSVTFKDPNPFALPAYYPYSYKTIYPRMTANSKLTFGQMIEAAIK